jgi:hypothetical protein
MPAYTPRPTPLERPRAAPAAPTLTGDGLCSHCSAPAKLICKGEVKVCSNCCAVLWHSGERWHKPAVAAPKGRPPAAG